MKFRKTTIAVWAVLMAAGTLAQANDYIPFNPPPPRSQPNQAPNQYPSNQPVYPVQPAPYSAPVQVAQGRVGTVEGATAVVDQRETTTGSGAVVGAILGGLLGRGISSGSTSGRNASTVVGAVAGGLIGNQVERGTRGEQRVTGYRLNVRLDDGTRRTVDHPVAFANGTRVVLHQGALRLAQASDFENTTYPSNDNSAYSTTEVQPVYKTRRASNNPARTTGLEG